MTDARCLNVNACLIPASGDVQRRRRRVQGLAAHSRSWIGCHGGRGWGTGVLHLPKLLCLRGLRPGASGRCKSAGRIHIVFIQAHNSYHNLVAEMFPKFVIVGTQTYSVMYTQSMSHHDINMMLSSGCGGGDPCAEADAAALREDERDAGQLQHALRHAARARHQGLQGIGLRTRTRPHTLRNT